jgi:hypothetical protein
LVITSARGRIGYLGKNGMNPYNADIKACHGKNQAQTTQDDYDPRNLHEHVKDGWMGRGSVRGGSCGSDAGMPPGGVGSHPT